MRLFIGISLTEKFSKDLYNESTPVRIDKTWRYVLPENWHITACFIGDFDGDLDILYEKIEAISSNTDVFNLNFDELTTVSFNQPRMVWLKGKRDENFTELCEKLNRSILNKKPDHKPTPHVTIARSKKDIQPIIIKQNFNCNLEVDEIHVWKSFLNKGGVNYKILKSFKLKSE